MEVNKLKKRKEVKKTESPIEEKLLSWLHQYQLYPEIQYEIGPYRADFYIEELNLVLEADGKDYHSSNKQIKRDKKRDEYMRSKGYRIMRVPGWRIHHEPYKVVKEIIDMFYPERVYTTEYEKEHYKEEYRNNQVRIAKEMIEGMRPRIIFD